MLCVFVFLTKFSCVKHFITVEYYILSKLLQDDESRRSVQEQHRMETEFDEEIEDEESDADDFIVDDDGRPITEKKKKVCLIVGWHAMIYSCNANK